MSVDVDAVNERLNGLVTLLKAVGVDSLGDSDMAKVNGGLGGLPNAQQLDDDQIEAIIKKLQQAQAEAPQIIAALEAHAEARSLTGSQSKGGRSSRQQQHQPEPEPEEDEDEEDDDEFDEDANYPMVGHGVSDDISVVSDLTTPTVLTGVPVPEEEHYRDTLPPMIVGGGGHDNAPAMIIAAPKKKNLVGAVRAGGPPRRAPQRGPGGAAAARRNKYQNTMAKLGEDGEHTGPAPRTRPMKPKPRPAAGSYGQPVRKKKPAHSASLRAQPQQNEFAGDSWNAFENKPKVPNKAPTMIDNDGFLTAEGFDPFGSDANNPFKSSAGDLEFGMAGGRFSSNASASGFDSFEGGRANPRKVKKKAPSMQSNFSAGHERKVRPAPGGGGAASGGARRPRARRASLAM